MDSLALREIERDPIGAAALPELLPLRATRQDVQRPRQRAPMDSLKSMLAASIRSSSGSSKPGKRSRVTPMGHVMGDVKVPNLRQSSDYPITAIPNLPIPSLKSKYKFASPQDQRKYYGIKRNLGYRKMYNLRDFWDMPIQRGSPYSRQLVGESYKLATPQQRMNRKSYMMSGRGKYMRGRGGFFGGLAGLLSGQGWDAGSKWGDQIWEGVKAIPELAPLGGVFAVTDPLGKALGPSLEAAYTSGSGMYKRGRGLYRGRGSYGVNKVITDGGATASSIVPQFSATDVHEIIYSNREFVRDIFAPTTSVAFSLQTWQLNPGLATSFPWLSQVAINFEEYEIIQLIYTYKSTVADFASQSGQVGQVVMATQYNPNSDPFADKEEMMLHDGGMSCKTTDSMLHGIECDPAKNSGAAQKYVRAGGLPPSEDLKNYDLGKTSLAIINVPTTYNGQQIGELWVSYTVRLRKPKLASLNAYNIGRDEYLLKQVTVTSISGQLTTREQALRKGARNSLGTTLTFPSGNIPTGAGTDDLTAAVPTQFTNTRPAFFQLDIPDSYSGILQIRIRQNYLVYPASPFQYYITVVSTAPDTIFRFKDFSVVSSTLSGTVYEASHIIATNQENLLNVGQISAETCVHLRILPPRNGVKNTLYFTNSGLNSPGFNCAFPEISISQYNTFLSMQDNGANDNLSLVDSFGNPALWS